MEKKQPENGLLDAAMNRREFLKDMGIGAVAAITAPTLLPLAGCTGENLAQVHLAKPAAPPAGVGVVSLVRDASIQTAVQKAIEMAGGLNEILPGDTVLVKPNIVGTGFGVRPYTHPLILQAVLQELKIRTDARHITVGEGSYRGPGSKGTLTNAQRTGILDVVQAEGVRFVAWDDETELEFVEVLSDDIRHIGYNIQLPKTLVDGTYDHFINLPIIKNHTWQNAGYTCCLKNFVGTLRLSNRNGHPLQGKHDWIDLARGVAELNLSTPTIAMNILDGLSVVLTGGPMFPVGMKTADANLILASKDRVAADSVALAVMRHFAALNPTIDEPYQSLSIWEQPQILRALELNLGRRKEHIEVVSNGVDEIEAILERWS